MMRLAKFVVLWGGVVGLSLAVWACDTPVYRYALYRWPATPYEVYFFRRGEADARVQACLAELNASRADELRPANVAAFDIDVAAEAALAGLPADVRAQFQAIEQPQLPLAIIVNPLGLPVGGPVADWDQLTTLIESPARKQLAAQLELGKQGVLVLLDGADAATNNQVESLLVKLAEDVASGKVRIQEEPPPTTFGAPNVASPSPTTDAPAAAATPASAQPGGQATPPGPAKIPTAVGVMRVRRDVPEEAWFVKSLLAVEPTLAELPDPMVFVAYGRGRVLPPYCGKGITVDNLVAELQFISGACSCTIKEQNPGVDLLVRYDWESAAAALAERIGYEEGNESRFASELLFPGAPLPAGTMPPAIAATSPTLTPPADTVPGQSSPPAESTAQPSTPQPTVADTQSAAATAVPSDGQKPADAAATIAGEPTSAEDQPKANAAADQGLHRDRPFVTTATDVQPPSATSVWQVGVGVAGALLAIFAVTLFVLRPR